MSYRAHPRPVVLLRFLRGEAAGAERRAVVRHLLSGCPECVAVTRPAWGARGGMNGGYSMSEGARQALRAVIEDLKAIRYRLWGVHASIPPSPQEISKGDLEGDPDVETELRTVIANGVRNCLDPFIDDLETAVEYQPDSAAAGSPSIAHLDLGVFSEAAQRELYEVVAAENFRTAKPESGEGSVPQYSAEQAGLEVTWAWGRWFASWWKLELPDSLPEAERREILLLQESRRRPGTLSYGEV